MKDKKVSQNKRINQNKKINHLNVVNQNLQREIYNKQMVKNNN